MSRLRQWKLRWLEHFLNRSDRLALRLGRQNQEPEHLRTGRKGEEAAYLYLRRHGYIVVARDWRSGKAPGDLDLIAWEDATLCFLEVKARTNRETATAESAIDGDKMQTLRRIARQYLRSLSEQPAKVRFDVISIYFENSGEPDIHLFRGAFGWH